MADKKYKKNIRLIVFLCPTCEKTSAIKGRTGEQYQFPHCRKRFQKQETYKIQKPTKYKTVGSLNFRAKPTIKRSKMNNKQRVT